MDQRKEQYKQPFSKAAIILTFTELRLYKSYFFSYSFLKNDTWKKKRMTPGSQPEVTVGVLDTVWS